MATVFALQETGSIAASRYDPSRRTGDQKHLASEPCPTQTMTTIVADKVCTLTLPGAHQSLLDGVTWGQFDSLFTPAFWRGQLWQHDLAGHYQETKLGQCLREETAACLLGGFGMPAAMGMAAFKQLRSMGLLEVGTTEAMLHRALLEPLIVNGSPRRYRFPAQKARHLATAIAWLEELVPARCDRDLRDSLVEIPGIGPKTASWIVRNHRGSDRVAIIDIHILRAGRLAGIFPASLRPERDYGELERRFLAFSDAMGVRASRLDALIWDVMRRLPTSFVQSLSNADDA